MPTAVPVTASSMNYASVCFAGFALVAILWYVFYARKYYTGPPVVVVEAAEEEEASTVMGEAAALPKTAEA